MGLVTCQDELEIANGFETKWYVAIGYLCEDDQSDAVDIKYSISIQDLQTVDCRPLDKSYSFQAACKKFYSNYAMPNLLGYSQNEIVRVHSLVVNLYLSSNCYEHFLEFSCRTLLPECDAKSKTIINSPCKQMCQDWMSGCSEIVPVYTECNLYPDSKHPSQCVHRNITCDDPDLSPNSVLERTDEADFVSYPDSVTYLAGELLKLSCHEGFHLHGNDTIMCMYNGQWSNMPECIITPLQKVIKHTAACVVPTTVLSLALITLILYRKFRLEIRAIIKHGPLENYISKVTFVTRFWKSNDAVTAKKYHGYVCCSEEPKGSEHQFIQEVAEKLPSAKLFIEDNIFPGQLEMTKKLDALYESCTFIALLSEANASSDSFTQMFQFAQEIHGQDRNFRFLVIRFQGDSQVECLPHFVTRYLKYGSIFGYVDEIQFKQTGALMWKMMEEVIFSQK